MNQRDTRIKTPGAREQEPVTEKQPDTRSRIPGTAEGTQTPLAKHLLPKGREKSARWWS